MADYRGGIGAQPGFEKSWQDPQGALLSQKSTRNQPGRVWSFPREKSPKGHSAGSRGESPACDHRGPAGSGEKGLAEISAWALATGIATARGSEETWRELCSEIRKD